MRLPAAAEEPITESGEERDEEKRETGQGDVLGYPLPRERRIRSVHGQRQTVESCPAQGNAKSGSGIWSGAYPASRLALGYVKRERRRRFSGGEQKVTKAAPKVRVRMFEVKLEGPKVGPGEVDL